MSLYNIIGTCCAPCPFPHPHPYLSLSLSLSLSLTLSLFADLLHTAHRKDEKVAERSAVSASSAAATRQAARATQQTAQVRKVRARVEEKPFEDFEILPPRKPAEREPVTGERCSTGKLCVWGGGGEVARPCSII